MTPITSKNFHAVILLAPKIGILVFKADWCGPSKALLAILEQAAPQFPEIVFGTVDLDTEPGIVRHWKVRATPWMIAFKGGEPFASRMAAGTDDQVFQWLEGLVA